MTPQSCVGASNIAAINSQIEEMNFGAVSSAVKTKMTKQTSSWRKEAPFAKPQYNGPTPKVY
jgi:hypothetical protein